MHLDLIERRAATAQLAAVIQRSIGGGEVEAPDPDVLRRRYLAALAEPPRVSSAADVEQAQLHAAFGVG